MSDKINVFEILGQKHTELDIRGQEHIQVPDPDFNDAIKQLGQKYAAAPVKSKQVQNPEKAVSAAVNVAEVLPPVRKKEKKKHTSKPAGRKTGKRTAVLKMLASVAVVLLFFTFVLNISSVSGASMEPGLSDGDRVVINRMARNFEKGDIIVFRTDGGSKLVKRIVATDGDVVNITSDKGFLVNGSMPEENYIYSETAVTDIRVSYPVIIDEDEYFVLGDNRMNSKDSRNADVGILKKEDIVGKVIFSMRKY